MTPTEARGDPLLLVITKLLITRGRGRARKQSEVCPGGCRGAGRLGAAVPVSAEASAASRAAEGRSRGRLAGRDGEPHRLPPDRAKPEDLFRGQWQHNRTSLLDEYKPYLDERWDDGCTHAWKLWEEIVPLGYRGSYGRVNAYLREKRTSPRPVTAQSSAPRVGSRWILSRPETLTEIEQLQLKIILANCPELDALTGHIRSFAHLLTERQGERLPQWIDAVRQDDMPRLHTLAAGIDRDRDAVIAGLTLPWNSGVVEEHVNRIRMLKRQMFGRAGFNLLRKRVLLSA